MADFIESLDIPNSGADPMKPSKRLTIAHVKTEITVVCITSGFSLSKRETSLEHHMDGYKA
jgi:hypothetical protein